MTKRPSLLLLFFVFCVTLAFVGCGGDEEPTPMPTPTALPAAEVATVAPATAAPTAIATETSGEGAELAQPESPLQAESPLLVDSPLPTPTPLPVAYDADTQEGLAEVRGRAINPITGQPIAKTFVRLAELYCAPDADPNAKADRCIWGLDDAQSPFAETDDNGNFVFTNVIPGEFVFFVGTYTVKNGYAIALSDDGVAIIYAPVADKGLDLGEVKVIFPPPAEGE